MAELCAHSVVASSCVHHNFSRNLPLFCCPEFCRSHARPCSELAITRFQPRDGRASRFVGRACTKWDRAIAVRGDRAAVWLLFTQSRSPSPWTWRAKQEDGLRLGEHGATITRSMNRVRDDGFIRSNLAVFLSGGGSNFRALHAATLNNSIYGDVVVVVSDKPGCKGCDYARENKLPVLSYPLSKHSPSGLSESGLVAALRDYGVDYILLAGYLKIVPPEVIKAFPRAVLNIHPSLLPSFGGKGYYGPKVHEAVIRSGARFSGATIHFVDENFDTGPILAQRVVPVLSDDTSQDLAARVLKLEHTLYPEAVAALCEDRIFWREDGVPLIRKSWDSSEYC